ncbi:MAG: biopolymer transporter ExbD [Gammaproteobacteria bacterium]|nr:biopolymer transporter ExbD [Gammaproteobacteria bacterium]
MIRRWRRHRAHAPAEMNITAFMNLMVILVPFLLITAVFSHFAILELELPKAGADEPPVPPLALEVTVRADRLEVADHGRKSLLLPDRDGRHDYHGLDQVLQQIKSARPEEKAITLLLEHDTDYDTLVQVMDRVRSTRVVVAASVVEAELFPDISIGDATGEVGGQR